MKAKTRPSKLSRKSCSQEPLCIQEALKRKGQLRQAGQPKLSVGETNAPLEREADRIAERVVSATESAAIVKGGAIAEGGQDISRADPELTPVLGPTFGTGAGVDLETLTVSMDVEHLQNLLKGPNVQTLTLGAALHF